MIKANGILYSPDFATLVTLSSASGKEGRLKKQNAVFYPLSAEGEERVDQRSVVGVSQYASDNYALAYHVRFLSRGESHHPPLFVKYSNY
jgi:hypothetical protein